MKGTQRRNFLKNAAKAGLLALAPIQVAKAAAKQPLGQTSPDEEKDFLTLPYLQNMGPTYVTVMWITNEPYQSWVEVTEPGGPVQKVYHATNGLVDYSRINRVKLTQLKPGVTYTYTVFSKQITNFEAYKIKFGKTISQGPFTFSTPAENSDSLKLIIFNDLHDHPETITELCSKYAADKDYDFAVVNGDAFNFVNGEERIINDLIAPCTQQFASNKPLLFTQGNHEVRGNFARSLFNYFDYPDNKYYYSFTQGPVHFIVLDSGEDKEDNHPEYSGMVSFDDYRREQEKWLAQEINTKAFKNAAFRVVLIHIPVFHSGDWHGTTHCRELFNPHFNKGKIDLAISGHTHRFGTFDADPATHRYPIVIGGGPKVGTRTLIKLQATRQELNLQMLKDDGTLVGKYNLRSKRG